MSRVANTDKHFVLDGAAGSAGAAAHGEKTRYRFVKRCASDCANGFIDIKLIFRAVQEDGE